MQPELTFRNTADWSREAAVGVFVERVCSCLETGQMCVHRLLVCPCNGGVTHNMASCCGTVHNVELCVAEVVAWLCGFLVL